MHSEEAPATVASQATYQRSLEFAGVVVGITSADHAALEWLVEFLDPWWRTSLGAADWSVHIDVSASRYRAARAALPVGAKAGDCFLFDQQVFTLPAWDEEGQTNVALSLYNHGLDVYLNEDEFAHLVEVLSGLEQFYTKKEFHH